MTDKEIRNKMYALFSDFVRQYKPDFVMNNEFRKPIKDIMEEYRVFFQTYDIPHSKVVLEKSGDWKPYPKMYE